MLVWLLIGAYCIIGYLSFRLFRKLDREAGEESIGDELAGAIIWPYLWCVSFPAFLFREWFKERGEERRQKLLVKHKVDSLQVELNRYQELRRLIPEKERELVALKQEKDVLEAQRAGTYREAPVIAEREMIATGNWQKIA